MMFTKILKKIRGFKMTMQAKLSLGLGAIAAILLLSSVISVVEYGRMSNYVSDLIAADINSINTAQKMAGACEEYNLKILAAIGDGNLDHIIFDETSFMSDYESLRSSFSTKEALEAADSVIASYSAYMLASFDLERVMASDFVDSRQWYFGQLQPAFKKFRYNIEFLNNLIYKDLKENSETFQDGFYRSIMPGVVSVGAGLLLVILLLFFIISYYVRPICRMLAGIENYRRFGRRYGYTFDGDDELVAINEGLSEIIEENVELKKRLSRLKEERERLIESSENSKEE